MWLHTSCKPHKNPRWTAGMKLHLCSFHRQLFPRNPSLGCLFLFCAEERKKLSSEYLTFLEYSFSPFAVSSTWKKKKKGEIQSVWVRLTNAWLTFIKTSASSISWKSTALSWKKNQKVWTWVTKRAVISITNWPTKPATWLATQECLNLQECNIVPGRKCQKKQLNLENNWLKIIHFYRITWRKMACEFEKRARLRRKGK